MSVRMVCECGSVRWVAAGLVFPSHPDMREASAGRFRWCEHGDMSNVIVGVVEA